MSIFRMPTLDNISTRFERIRERLSRDSELAPRHQKTRHLALDPLEERQLLSVTPADFTDTLVNQTVSEDEVLFATHGRYGNNWDTPQSMAMDDDGDFVVTWTRYDQVVDENGSPIEDPVTGEIMRDANVYARYFTDEVQRISLPDSLAENNIDGQYGSFTVKYGGNEVQKLTVSATHEPYQSGGWWQDNIVGGITLGFDVNGSGDIGPNETATIFYNESNLLATTATELQTALQGLGGALADVTVQPISPTEFEIHFGDFSLGEDQPMITVEGTSFTNGFLPAVDIEALREPVELGPIYVSPTDPNLTATSIEENFRLTMSHFDIAPYEFTPPGRINNESLGPYYYPDSTRQGVPTLNVRPIEEYVSYMPDMADADGDGDTDEPLPDASGNTLLDVGDLDGDGDTSEYRPWFDEGTEWQEFYPDVLDVDSDGDTDEPLPDAGGNPILDSSDLDNDGDTTELQPWLAGKGSQIGMWQTSLTDFEITFDGALGSVEGAAGKKDHPELVFVSATTDDNLPVDIATEGTVHTVKEPSPEFRVNPEEPEDPFTPLPDKFDQKDSVVAMDADGNFAIAWESEIPDWQNAASLSDVFVRQFTPVGNEVSDALEFVPGIMAMGDTNQVNENTPGMQGDPSIGMDDAGNFTVAWASGAQDLSYFNSVRARSFDRDFYKDPENLTGANYAGSEFLVNREDTSIHFNPYVAVSPGRGDILVVWTNTDDEHYVTNSGLASSILATVFDPSGNVIMNQFAPGGWNRGTAAFDKTEASNFIIAWDDAGENQNPPADLNNTAARARMWRLYNDNGSLSPQQVRSEFAVNSADFNPGRTALWPNFQGYVNPALDADGDLTVVYNGFGPDVSDDEFLNSSYYADATADPANADLLQYFPFGFSLTSNVGANVDVDTAIELELIRSANAGATLEQLGRIREVLNSKASLLRGDANGVMYSQFDADPNVTNVNNILYSDNIANEQRDGHNQKYVIAVDSGSESGSFELRVWAAHSAGFEDVTVNNIHTNNRLDLTKLVNQTEAALRGAGRTGVNWPTTRYEGPVEVRLVSPGFGNLSTEFVDRQVTLADGSQPWAYYVPGNIDPSGMAYIEVTFQGEVHDAYVALSINDNDLSPDEERDLYLFEYQEADSGITQEYATIEMETDGDFTLVWMQQEEHTSDSDSGFPWSYGSGNQNIYYRRFDESTDTAGPRVTDLIDHSGNRVDNGATIDGAVRHLVITFDEALMNGDPDTNPHSALNTNNWLLSQDGIAIPGAIAQVEFGLNKASELAGTYDGVGDANGGFGERYDLSDIPTNKWEAVITLDANGADNEGEPRLGIGLFEISALNGLQDASGNPLGAIGPSPNGVPFTTRDFWVTVDLPDMEIDEDIGSSNRSSGTLHAETPNAVAVDADGDHVVVWTSYDSTAGHDRIYWRMFDSDGSPADLPKYDQFGNFQGMEIDAAPVLPVTSTSDFFGDIQRYGSVAIDPDGDFVVTWTNYDGGDADIYARSFPAQAVELRENPLTGSYDPALNEGVGTAFQVNDYTQDAQKWSDVALDREGNFVITWSSYAQELNGELGSGYGVYARRYDSEDRALAPESQVNVTTAGDQQTPSIAIAARGDYVIAWTSDQNGTDDDIIVREFDADGSAKQGPLSGERIANDITMGHQRNPDVAMRFDGYAYVVTWTDTAADISGTSVWAALSSPQPKRYLDPLPHLINATHNFTINVGDSFTIADLDLQLGWLYHYNLPDLEVRLSHGGVTVVLFEDLPRPSLVTGLRPGYNPEEPVMNQTILDDQAPSSIRIFDTDAGAVPDYSGRYVPQEVLAPFVGQNAQGTWTLTVIDRAPGNGLTGQLVPVSPAIGSWNLDITEATQLSPPSFLVNTTTAGHQLYPSVAMDTYGEFVVTWSGKGTGATLTSGHEVYYQRYDRGGTRVGYETLVNLDTDGDQWISSIGMDARGNYVIAWMGAGALPGTNSIFKYDSIRNFPQIDNDGPIVTDVFAGTQRIFNGSVIISDSGIVTQMKVTFNEQLSSLGGADGQHSVLNPNNWGILRNDVEIVGGVTDVQFGLNPLTNKWEALVTFDGNGVNFGTPGLEQGDFVLTVRDLITDTSRFIDPDEDPENVTPGNFLDGDIDGVPGSQPITIGRGGYEHYFSIAAGAQIGPEFRVNEDATVPYEQRISAPGGLGQAREESNRSVAVDNDGDFAVVWTTYGLDDPTDPNSGGVYVRLYDRENNPLTPEFQVNQNATGHQRNASIAMDTDGDFVIVWEGEGTSLDGSWDIFARRYDSMGRPQGDEFLVNSTTTANQLNPTVAMDDRGAFVIGWATSGQDFSFFNDVYAQRFDRFGEAQGSEFRVNENDFPGALPFPPSAFEINPSVTMSGATGNFVFAWEVVISQQNGVATNTIIAGRTYDADGGNASREFQLDSGVGSGGGDQFRTARNPQMAMNDQDGFYLVWEAYTGADYSVYYREFNSGGGVVATGSPNTLAPGGHHVNPSIGVDADGDFSLVWNGPGVTGDPLDPTNPAYHVDFDDFGVFKLDYNAANQTVGTQERVNWTTYGAQYQATIGMEPDGDAVVVWSGVGVGDNHGIFARRYNEPTDTAGPTISDWADEQGTSLDNGHIFEGVGNEVQYLVLTFDEDMLQSGDDSVTNPANYALLRGGINVPGSVIRVEYGLNKTSEMSGLIDPLPNATLNWDNTSDVQIPALGTVVSTIDVPKLAVISDIMVDFEFDIIDADDLTISLVSPSGTTAIVTGNNVSMSDFDDEDITGPWRLVITNNSGIAGGVLDSWDLIAETNNRYNFNTQQTNKYEAILTLDGDLADDGLEPLEDASYQIQALAAVPGFRSGLRDVVGNVQYRTGLTPTGRDFTASFIVQIDEPPPPPQPDPPTVTDPPVTAADWDAVLVNQVYSDSQFTSAGHSLAVDNDGDFVVTWTRYDDVVDDVPTDGNIYARYFTDEVQRLSLPSQMAVDSDGQDSTQGSFTLEYNAAEMQMLSITAGIQPFTTDDTNGAVNEDEVGQIEGSFMLGYDLTGDGSIGDDPGVREVVSISNFSEATMPENAEAIQTALRSLGGELAGVSVRAINPRDYMIEFAEDSAGLDITEVTVEAVQLVQAYLPAVSVTTMREGMAFEGIRVSQDNPLATAQSIENAVRGLSTSYGPLGPIDFPSPDRVTANSDEAPYEAPWWTQTISPEVQVTPVITPDGTMSLTDFDITFIGSSGKQDHPELAVSNAKNDQGLTVSVPSDTVTTRKEPSNEFRVNPLEADDPTTPGNDTYDQINPSVAMDADGDFVIAWESAVPNSENFGSVSDIFAKRFSPFGKTTADVPGEITDIFGGSTGIRDLINAEAEDVQRLTFNADNAFDPLVGTFRLKLGDVTTESIAFDSEDLRATADDIEAKLADADIEGVTVIQVPTATTGRYRLELRFGGDSAGIDYPTIEYVADVPLLAATVSAEDIPVDMVTIHVNQDTANPQFDPAVAMDESGAFVVTWANGGQTLSYFNHISVQRFNRDGDRVGNEFQVNAETTSIQFAPSVALSNTGNFLVTWSTTDDVEYVLDQVAAANVRAKVFDATGNQLVGEFSVGGGGRSMAAFDADDNYVITWDGLFDTTAGVTDAGVRARQFALYDSAGQPNNSAVEIRPEFRINSSAADPADPLLWPYHQYFAQPALDADGDLTVIYEGYGPDVSVDVSMAAGYFASLMSKPANQDLWVFFDPFNVYERGQEGVPVGMLTQFLGNNGDVDGSIDQVLFRANELGATTGQLGRLRAIMEQTVGQLRGEANGILVSQWDTDPTLNTQVEPLFSDSVINSYRDGQNQRSYLEVPMQFSLTDSRWYQAERGTFTVQVTNLETGQIETAVVDIASNGMGQPMSIEGTRQNLEAALEGLAIMGSAWSNDEGPIDIREVEPDEIIDRSASDWEIDEVDETLYDERSGGVYLVQGFRNLLFEVEFQGSAHDNPFELEVISSDTERGGLVVAADGTVTIEWVAGPPIGPAFFGDTYGTAGTLQTLASIGMEPDGDYTAVYTQLENYRNAGFVDDGTANTNIYYRRFDETTDTAGPRVTDWADGNGGSLEDSAVLQNHLQYVVMTFDEEMLSGDPAEMADSILNSENFKLFESNAEVKDGIINVAFGLSKAAELAGQIDPLTGQVYGLDAIPSNKWEAIITLDGDPDASGAQPLRDGFYSFEALASVSGSSTVPGHSGLRDRVGNTLYHTGFDPAGADFQRSFSIKVTERKDEPVNDPAVSTLLKNAHTHPESPGAVAADADGHYAVVWTATDTTQGNREKIFYRLFDADGSPADLPVVDNQTGTPILGIDGEPIVVEDAYPVLPLTPKANVLPGFEEFAEDTQGFATVAMDKDGDFVVTWTNNRDGDNNIYGRRLNSMGELAGVDEIGRPVFMGGTDNTSAVSDAFLVNSYTDDSQKWSNVAMDVDGDFIITWSSYGQEDGGQLGSGYGVYARRYDSFGQPLAGEFQVNVTEAGSQQFSNVAMDSQGGFTVAWTSDQNGISDDIVIRDFNPDGTPVGGPLGGEVVANQTLTGDQRYPDIAMNLAGDQYVVTWSASGQDGSGWGVYGRLFNRSNTTLWVPSSPAMSVPDTGTVEATLNVSNNAIITDLNVRLELRHASPADLEVHLVSPNGTDVELFTNVPGTLANGSLPQGADFSGTLFDDAAAVAIDDPDAGAVPPFAGTFAPLGSLADFNGENVNGQWRLRITDSNGNDRTGVLEQWSLIVERSPVAEQEFRVNTTSVGNQTYSSVAMDHQGEFVVTWSGFGNQPEHEDPSGSGVFLQRFEATGNRIGDESRVNMTTEGDQAVPSVSSDGVGNYYVAFTGVRRDDAGNNIAGETDVYVLASNSTLILQDNDPPIVTDVQLADGTRLLQGDVIPSATDRILVMLGESMSLDDMTNIESTDNWDLEHNGGELMNAIESVDFHFNATTRKYEAELTLSQSVLPLSAGEYQLTASSVISDNVNSLDGDLDGIPGSNPTTTTQPGYQFRFNVSNSDAGASVRAEYRINTETSYQDQFSASLGTGTARETSSATLAVDHDGDYVAVWTRYGADDENDPTGAGVYMRLFDRNDQPLTEEKCVNTMTSGHQRNPAVAMDADGDLVVVWESEGMSQDDSYDVYARRVSSVGEFLDDAEFRVNTTTAQNQVNPAVAMDDEGNFAVVWATSAKPFGFSNDVHGQLYNKRGEAQGLEFLVNSQNLPGISPPADGSFEINPAIGMSGATGSFVVAWEVVTAHQDGVVTDTELAARQFTAGGTPVGAEFAADTGAGSGGSDMERVARNPQLAVGDDDSFIIVWESYTGTDYDVFYQEFDAAGAAVADAQVNMAQFAGQQVNPSVGMDVDGDFGIVFNGAGAQPDPLAPNNPALYADADTEGIWVRRYDSTSTAISVQSRANITEGGIQQFPTIGMEPDGDYVVAWSGRGVGDHHGIFVRRYDTAVDAAGPRMTEIRLADGTIVDTEETVPRPMTLSVVFDEDMLNTGEDRVTNPENWELRRNGVEMPDNTIDSITYSLNTATNKYEAVLHFNGYLPAGEYTLTALAPVPDIPNTDDVEGNSGMRDAVGNPLLATGQLPDGTDAMKAFRINSQLGPNTGVPGPIDPPDPDYPLIGDGSGAIFDAGDGRLYGEARGSVATDADGDHIAVLTGIDEDTTSPSFGQDRVYYRRFDSDGNPTSVLIPVLRGDSNAADFDNDHQRYSTVAADADGDFVVTWTNFHPVVDSSGQPVIDPVTGTQKIDADIYGRRFSADGQAQGDSFLVNTYTDDNQVWSSVAMDVDGDFVITWSSYAQEMNGQQGSGYGVYARRYDSFGQAQAPEFQVNVTESGDQRYSVVDMTSQGAFVVAWQSQQGSLGDEIIARLFNEDGSPRVSPNAGEITVNDTSAGNQRFPDVAITPDGDNFIVTWTASGSQDGSGSGVYGQMINIPLLDQLGAQPQAMTYTSSGGAQPFSYFDSYLSTITVSDQFPNYFSLFDVDLTLNIDHASPVDVEVRLRAPSGTEITLFENVPRHADSGSDFFDTLFDDEALNSILSTTARPPFIDVNGYIPQEPLSTFDGQLSSGDWTLIVQDVILQSRIDNPGDFIPGTFNGWTLTLTPVPAKSGEFLVNTTTAGDQSYSTVDMNNQGDFTVAWHGNGEEEFEEDNQGVFFQQFNFNLSQVGGESRANTITDGDQVYPSIGSDGAGNFALVWQGPGTDGNVTDVYRFLSKDVLSVEDNDGPWVTDVLMADGERVLEGDVLPVPTAGTGGVDQLRVLFSEDLSVRVGEDGTPESGPDSVLNPANWVLERNSSVVQGAITDVDFSFNQSLGKWEAILTLDGNGANAGTAELPAGDYVLTVLDNINDKYDYDVVSDDGNYFLGNRLDGDFDGAPGTRPESTGYSGYKLRFSVSESAQLGPEIRVNEVDSGSENYVQVFGPNLGTGQAREETKQSVAVDHDGDFAVVWTSYGQDNASEASGAGVYMRLYDRMNNPLTPEILVNETTAGDQRNASIAMDADGDLFVVWEAEGMGDDNSWDIYGRRFDSVGTALGGEFRVNEETANDQLNPSVSMDYFGNTVVVWATNQGGTSGFFNNIWGRAYHLDGQASTSDFQVNDTALPALAPQPGVSSTNPSVALGPSGIFAVAWDQITAQTNGTITDSQIVAKFFSITGDDLTPEFQADDGGGTGGDDRFRTARNPQVGLDENSNMTVVWEAYGADDVGVTDSYGVFFQQFDILIVTDPTDPTVPPVISSTAGATGQVNIAEFVGEQVNPAVGVDADGDFTVVWNGAGGENDPLDPTNPDLFGNIDSEGVWLRNFDPLTTPSSGQYRVNKTMEGVQNYPAIAMEPDGDHVVVWQGQGVGDRHGVFVRRYDTVGDTAGPLATELRTATGELIDEGDNLFDNPTTLTVVFNEEMSTSGGATGFHSVENPNNWAMVDGRGSELVGAISKIDFSLNPATNKWEAVLTFNTARYPNGLENGYYALIARTQLYDLAGNALAMTGLRPSGTGLSFVPPTSPTGGMGFSFRVHELTPGDPNTGDLDPIVNTTLIGTKSDSAVARNASGQYVVAWAEERGTEVLDTDGNPIIITSTEIFARMFDANDKPMRNRYGSYDAFLVNSLTVGDQITPDVAIDDDGNFIVVWSGVGISGMGEQDDEGIFGQLFSANGDPIGGQFGVNQSSDGIQDAPAVAMDASTGDFVVTWASHEQGGIMARRFAASGAASGEFLVNETTGTHYAWPDVAMDNQGEFAVTWTAQDSSSFGVYAQRFTANSTKIGGEFQVNQFTDNQQEKSRIAMDDNGAFVIAWQSFGQDAFGGYGVYARQYDANGNTASDEFRVNTETASYQFEPSVAMDSNGDFVVTWSGFDQEGDRGELYGIFAKMYNADGSLFVVPGQTTPVGEFRINAIVEGDQRNSDASMDAAGHYVVVWEGTSTRSLFVDGAIVSTEHQDIYARFVDPPATVSADGKTLDLVGTPGQDTFEFVAGAAPGSWLIKVNGEVYTAASTVDTVNFDGMGGDDIVTLTGTSGVEKVYTRPGEVTFEGSNFTVNATDVEDVTVDGKGGVDVAELRDSAGSDSLVMEVDKTTLAGSGFSSKVIKFEEVYAYATNGGVDEAKLYDTDGNEVFTATPEFVRMDGNGFMHRAKGFRYAHGYSTGGADVAEMHDSDGNDKFKHYKGQSKMFGGGFYARAKNFPEVNAIADGGGNDYARIFDTSSVDKFVGTPTMARMYSTQADYDVTTELFEEVLTYSINGGNDIARFYDTDAKEIFVGKKAKAQFYNGDFEITARKFETVEASSTEGSGDIAKLWDTDGNDHLVVNETSAKLYEAVGDDMELLYEAFAFDQVKTYRSSGNDTKDVESSVDFLLLDDGWVDG
jgi:large repetitive protein